MRDAAFGKAVLFGNIAHFLSVAIFAAIGSIFTTLIAWQIEGDPQGLTQAIAAVTSSSVFASIFLAASILPGTFVAGYLGAMVAGAHRLLFGALATGVWVAIGVVASFYEPPDALIPKVLSAFLLYGLPAVGALGGYFAVSAPTPSSEAHSGRLFGRQEIAVFRWLGAILLGGAIYAVFSIATLVVGGLASIFAVVVTTTVVTAVAPAAHRRFTALACLILMLAVPIGTLAARVTLVGLEEAHSLPTAFALLGAGLSYLILHRAFPESFQTRPDQWWWLSGAEYARWSAGERRARIGLGLTGIVVWTVLYALMSKAFESLGLAGGDVAISAAMILAGVAALFSSRPIFALLWPGVLATADSSARARLTMHMPR